MVNEDKIKLVITLVKWVDPNDLSYIFNDYGAECDSIIEYMQSMKKSLCCQKFDQVQIARVPNE